MIKSLQTFLILFLIGIVNPVAHANQDAVSLSKNAGISSFINLEYRNSLNISPLSFHNEKQSDKLDFTKKNDEDDDNNLTATKKHFEIGKSFFTVFYSKNSRIFNPNKKVLHTYNLCIPPLESHKYLAFCVLRI